MKFIASGFALSVVPFGLTVALAGALTGGCSAGGASAIDPGVVRGDASTDAASTSDATNPEEHKSNPYGTPYPTNDLGTNARKGSIVGNRMANLRFLGYPTGSVDDGVQVVAMADFFDPLEKKYSIIHIQAAGSWCTYCQQEAREFTPEVAALQARKIGWLTVLAEGTSQGKGASLTDLNKWIAQHKSPNPHALDTDSQNLGVFFPAGGLPWNAILDARSMEILAVSVGYAGLDGTKAELDRWLGWVADPKNAPKP